MPRGGGPPVRGEGSEAIRARPCCRADGLADWRSRAAGYTVPAHPTPTHGLHTSRTRDAHRTQRDEDDMARLGRLRTIESLYIRDYRLLWLGQVSTSMGQWMDQVDSASSCFNCLTRAGEAGWMLM